MISLSPQSSFDDDYENDVDRGTKIAQYYAQKFGIDKKAKEYYKSDEVVDKVTDQMI